MRVNEVAEELGVSIPYAYKLIRMQQSIPICAGRPTMMNRAVLLLRLTAGGLPFA